MSAPPNLHLAFVNAKSENVKELLGSKALKGWTCPSTAKPGDVVLFYLGAHPQNGIHAVGVVKSVPQHLDKAPDWGAREEGTAWFADYGQVRNLEVPVELAAIKASFPRWSRWKYLLGVRVHTVPNEYRKKLCALVLAGNPWVQRYLSRWVTRAGETGTGKLASLVLPKVAPDDVRYEGAAITRTQVRYERFPSNRLRALALANPPHTCVVCGFHFGRAYGGLGEGFIEVHHVVPVSSGRRKPKDDDLQLLCSNCHSMAHWRSGKRPRSIQSLRKAWKANGSKLAGRRR